MIPEIARRKLAKFCDVFCDTGAFTVEESRVILTTARKFGLGLRIHADELAPSGGSKLAAELGTLSADHLVEISEQGIKALKKAGVVPVLLPGTSFHLGKQSFAPARKIIKAGLPVALSTDFNPGTSMTENLQTIMTIACVYMRMTPYEALRGVTINAAKSLGIDKNNGSVHPGKKADLLLLDVPNINYIPYHFGVNHVHTVIKNGRVAVSDRKKPLFFSG
jgi:imidazolonepropionase